MTGVEHEPWTTLKELPKAVVKRSKAAATSASSYTRLQMEHMFDSKERGYPASESILFGDLTPADVVSACVAPMGGLIAIYPAPLQLAVTPVPELGQVTITNPSGSHQAVRSLTQVLGHKPGSLVAVGWAEPEMLLCVSSKGSCSVISPKGQKVHTFPVSSPGTEVVHACVFHSGVVTLAYSDEAQPELTLTTWVGTLATGQIEVSPKMLPMPSMQQAQLFESIALVGLQPVSSDAASHFGSLQVVLAPKDGGLLCVTSSSHFRVPFPWTAKLLAVGPVTGQPLAVVTAPGPQRDSSLHIIPACLHELASAEESIGTSVKLDDIQDSCKSVDENESPEQQEASTSSAAAAALKSTAVSLAWISESAVTIVIKQEQGGKTSRRLYAVSCTGLGCELELEGDEACHVSGELDGCVVLGESSWSLVRDVPLAVHRALGDDKEAPAHLLVTASQHYNDRDARCEILLSDIRHLPCEPPSPSGALNAAVTDAVFAAGWSHKVSMQRELLRAAIYGRTHAPQDIDAALIPLCAYHARILNTLHNGSKVGRGTTRMQLEWLILRNRLQYIADVLCSSEEFVLAFDLASDNNIPIAGGPVLLRWAQAVIDSIGHKGEECLAFLRKQLDNATGVSWATVAGYALEKQYLSLGEELLALDPRDRHAVPQLMRRKPYSEVALTKALGTSDEDLVLLVLLHSFDATEAADQARQFSEFLRDKEGTPRRGVLHEQAADTWLNFVLALATPLPNVTLGALKSQVFAQHYNYALPLHRALLTLSEVVVSTVGPPKEGEPLGSNKGRSNPLGEWDMQQRLLQEEADTLNHPSSVRKVPTHDGPRRGISGVSGGGKGAAWWQANALRKFRALRERQQMLESQSQVHLVGLSVVETARKLRSTRNDALYEAFVREFLPEHGRGAHAQRNSRTRFAIECDALASRQMFSQLLSSAEQGPQNALGDEKSSLLVTAALKHGIHLVPEFASPPLASRRPQLCYQERLGNILNSMSNTEMRETLREKLQSVRGGQGAGAAAGPSRTVDGSSASISPALSTVGETLLQQAGNLGQRALQGAEQVSQKFRR